MFLYSAGNPKFLPSELQSYYSNFVNCSLISYHAKGLRRKFGISDFHKNLERKRLEIPIPIKEVQKIFRHSDPHKEVEKKHSEILISITEVKKTFRNSDPNREVQKTFRNSDPHKEVQ